MTATMSSDAARVSRHLTMQRSFLPAWDRFADEFAVRQEDRRHTYAQHRERVLRIADGLGSQLGVGPRDRFAILALNSIEYLELYHASLLGAGVINPLNIRLAPKEIAFILGDSGSEVVFVDATFAPLVEAIRDQVECVRSVVLIGEGAPDGVRIDARYDDVLAAGAPLVPDEPDEDDPATLTYTGGTTGLPKGVLHSHRTITCNIGAFLDLLDVTAGDVYGHVTPSFHAASIGGVATAFSTGAEVAILAMFTPAGTLDLVESAGVTHIVLVPVMVRMVLDDAAYLPDRLRSLRRLGYGASPMPRGQLDRLMTDLPDCGLGQGYGMTEGLFISSLGPEDHRAGGDCLRSAGRPTAIVRIEGPDGEEAPVGTPGEVCVRSGSFMVGYWNRPEATADAFRGGWLHTGDVGYFDDEGFLYLVDRAKDMIVSGGENVYSAEVESAISTHPAVADVAVFGIPSEQWGEAVHAVVVPREGATLSAEDVIAHAREQIAGYKVPRSVEFRSEPLPVSGAGKTLKRELRDPHWAGQERSVN